MKVKRLYEESGLANHAVIQAMDGKHYMFNITPARTVTEKDLTELPYYNPIGVHGEEARAHMYAMYGMEAER